jgi:hypothetical protein
MKRTMAAFLLLLLASVCQAKQNVQVEVVASHAVTHDDQGDLNQILKALSGPAATVSMADVFNLDAIINGEHVTLLCRDKKGCENLQPAKYDGVVFGPTSMDLKFDLPSSHKAVKRHYQISRSW